ncbi:MAG: cyclic lactone autoinducer peptide [Bacilli bacterium]|nr:cyclic lactone autoinducer peptide [bacterium]
MKFLATAMALLGSFIASTATSACWILYFDEPEMPESLQD